MPPLHTTAVAAVAAAVAILGSFAALQGCGHREAAPIAAPPEAHLAKAGGADTLHNRQDLTIAGVGSGLEAARTVALYCRLIDEGQFARAGDLCATRRLWSRRALGALTRFHFRSARVYAVPDARTLVLKARVRVHAGRGRPLPDGLAVMFFTLGRAGNAVGGWLITAVSTSP
jgi:hypothetical protein